MIFREQNRIWNERTVSSTAPSTNFVRIPPSVTIMFSCRPRGAVPTSSLVWTTSMLASIRSTSFNQCFAIQFLTEFSRSIQNLESFCKFVISFANRKTKNRLSALGYDAAEVRFQRLGRGKYAFQDRKVRVQCFTIDCFKFGTMFVPIILFERVQHCFKTSNVPLVHFLKINIIIRYRCA